MREKELSCKGLNKKKGALMPPSLFDGYLAVYDFVFLLTKETYYVKD